ncbi:hypothetical protein FACS189459_2480 [Bacilli bacterium]|nr:hypothetical protein FACS189459_2480 [Bacilli bacterium]
MAKHKLYVAIMNAFLEFDLSPIQISSQHMGYIFEELIRKFSENKTAGEHYTPREVIKLLSGLAICDQTFQDSEILNIGDFACGTGGILSSVYDLINESVGKNKNIKINL